MIGFRVTFDSGKVILTKGGKYVGKGCCNVGLFVLDLIVKNKMNASIAYVAKSISFWHAKLVNIASINWLK